MCPQEREISMSATDPEVQTTTEHGDVAAAGYAQHLVKIRDLRLRVDAPEMYAAHCSCGWRGDEHRGHAGERLARREGREHAEAERLARFAPRPGARVSR
jgi:hypothetical protein